MRENKTHFEWIRVIFRIQILEIIEKFTMPILFDHLRLIKTSEVTFKNVSDAPLLFMKGYFLVEEVEGVKFTMKILTTITMHLDLAINKNHFLQ